MTQSNVRRFVIPAQSTVQIVKEQIASDNDISLDIPKQRDIIMPAIMGLLFIIACSTVAAAYFIITPPNTVQQGVALKPVASVTSAENNPVKAVFNEIPKTLGTVETPAPFTPPTIVSALNTADVASTATITAQPSNLIQSTPEEKEQARNLIVRAERTIQTTHDIATARLFLERALKLGDLRAALVLAQTYDPVALKQYGVKGFEGDLKRARELYQQAAQGGVSEAKLRLNQLR